jgi:putative hemin transport protein
MQVSQSQPSPQVLLAAWKALKEQEPKVRTREAARRFQVSECTLLATLTGKEAMRLSGDWKELVAQLPTLGTVMALSRNEAAVIEKTGPYNPPTFFGNTGQIVGDLIDLRLFMDHWHYGFALTENLAEGARHSLHFFDADGTAIHKIYLQAESNYTAYQQLVDRFRSEDQSPAQSVSILPPLRSDAPDESIDKAGLLHAWAEMKDTHEFFGMLRRFNVGRRQALRLATGQFVEPLAINSFQLAIKSAAESQLPIMIFVSSPGVLEIHTGPVTNVVQYGTWFNIMDPGFNLHLREDLIAEALLVKKPTADGMVHSVELFDAAGEPILLLFGKRKPGLPELEEWRELVSQLPRTVPAAVTTA